MPDSRHHFIPSVKAMDAFDISDLPSTERAAFVCSTTGQGETPDNMRRFWRFLRRADLPPDSLSLLKYSTFGLGDSSYPIFNGVARRLHERLRTLGGTPIVHRALGDDQHPMGYDGALEEWLPNFIKALKQTYAEDYASQWPEPIHDLFKSPTYHTCILRFSEATTSSRLEALKARLITAFESQDSCFGTTIPAKPQTDSVTTLGEVAQIVKNLENFDKESDPGSLWTLATLPACAPISSTHGEVLFPAEIAMNKLIVHPEHAPKQKVRHLIFDLRRSPYPELAASYKPGAVLSVTAPQPTATVREGLARLGLHPLDIVITAPSSGAGVQNLELTWPELYEMYSEQLLEAQCDPANGVTQFGVYPSSWPVPHMLAPMFDPEGQTEMSKLVASFAPQQDSIEVSDETEVPPVLFAYELVSYYLDFSARTSRALLPYLEQSAQYKAQRLFAEAEHDAHKKVLAESADYERERLHDFQTAVWANEWERYCVREGRSFLELMADFPHASLPLNWILELIPRPAPRQFSIASSSLYQSSRLTHTEPPTYISSTTEPGGIVGASEQYTNLPPECPQAHVCLAQVRYTTPYKRTKLGLCSTFLASMATPRVAGIAPVAWVSLRDPTFKYPSDVSTPLVMVGPGTGIAVFHAIAEHRSYLIRTQQVLPPLGWTPKLSSQEDCVPSASDTAPESSVASLRLGRARVFFGCRYSQNGDWYYADFFKRCVDEIGSLTSYDALFSRDHLRNKSTESKTEASSSQQEPTRIDRYVQHRMVRDPQVAFDIYQMLFEGKGTFIVSGNAKQMPKDVKKAVVAITEAFYPTPKDASAPLATQVPPTQGVTDVARGISEAQAEQLVARLIDEGRYIQECWG